MTEKPFTLSEFLKTCSIAIHSAFPQPVWISAEILKINKSATGHVYVELVEKQGERITAGIKGNIWAGSVNTVIGEFEQTSEIQFKPGVKILFKARVQFHEIYGMSLTILFIDPTYSLGELQRQKLETLNRLGKEALMEVNKGLKSPVVISKIAIISSETAAGYEDFVNQLENNVYGYKLEYTLFPSLVQGHTAVSSLSNALDAVKNFSSRFDVVVLLRGGGSKADLHCFDHYDVARRICLMSLPVFTGIGHERDQSISDMVAFKSLKTPTAVAEFIIDHNAGYENSLDNLGKRLLENCSDTLLGRKEHLRSASSDFSHVLDIKLEKYFAKMHINENSLSKIPGRIIRDKSVLLESFSESIDIVSNRRLKEIKENLDKFDKNLNLLSPQSILNRGFALLRNNNGTVITSHTQVDLNENIGVELKDGKLITKVIKK